MLFHLFLVGLAGAASVQAAAAHRPPKCCAAEKCFASASLPPQVTPIISTFCEKYIHSTPGTVTKTTTKTTTKTITPAQSTVVATATTSTTEFYPTLCSTTVAGVFVTVVNYPTRGAAAPLAPREAPPAIPTELSDGCSPGSLPSLISSACSCFLTSKTTTATATHTVSKTAAQPTPTTTTTTVAVTVSSSSCTSTTTILSYAAAPSCGIASPSAVTSGEITCTAPAPAGQTDGRLRIEGGDEGTIFEDCVSSGPEEVTTPSGGTHECNGLNDDANSQPGATATTQLNNAAAEDGFPYDGTFDASFDDYFITSIDTTTETATEFWGLLQNLAFTPTGGCQSEISTDGTQETLWAFNAFNVVSFLEITPQYQVVALGTATVTVTVQGSDGSGNLSPAAGATIEGGTTSGADGTATIVVPTAPGCYQYKATSSDSIRSNAFYLTVLPPVV